MAEIIRLRSSPHDDVKELLPWLVNGSLTPTETERAEAHLAECADCRADLAAERQLAEAVVMLPLDCGSGWQRMRQRLDLGAPARIRSAPTLWRKRVPLAWALTSPFAAAAAVALVFLNVTVPQQIPVQPQYRALGSADVTQPANLVVQFEPGTRLSDLQGALQEADARLVDGPTETGAYLLRVDLARREMALKRLRDSQAIALAEPIDAAARQ
jgi:hypothetical protein